MRSGGSMGMEVGKELGVNFFFLLKYNWPYNIILVPGVQHCDLAFMRIYLTV